MRKVAGLVCLVLSAPFLLEAFRRAAPPNNPPDLTTVADPAVALGEWLLWFVLPPAIGFALLALGLKLLQDRQHSAPM